MKKLSHWEWLLIVIILGELAYAGYRLVLRSPLPTAPLPPIWSVDALTARELKEKAAGCRSPEQWQQLAQAYWGSGFLPEAEACYRLASEHQPDNPDLHFHRAFCLTRLGRVEEAIEEYKTALELKHSDPSAIWYFVGRNCLRLEQREEAVKAFSRASKLALSQYELAKMEAQQGEAQKAKERLDAILELHPDALNVNLLRSRLELMAGETKAAMAFADRAERYGKRLGGPYDDQWQWLQNLRKSHGLEREKAIGSGLIEREDYAAAASKLRIVLEIEWALEQADQLAEAEIKLQRPEEAIRLMKDAIERDGPTMTALSRQGEALDAMGRPLEAGPIWQRAVRNRSSSDIKDLLFNLAVYSKVQKDEKQSNRYLAQGLQAGGATDLRQGNVERARPVLEKSTELDPTQAQAWFYLGEAYRALGNPEKAQKAYRECLKRNPNHGRAIRILNYGL